MQPERASLRENLRGQSPGREAFVMERGVYFDAWFKHNFCYHPSLPLRSAQMLEDLKKYRASVLVWAGMGGGSISLPWLHHEAFGEVDPRMRFFGFMNDSEFAAECEKLGIKLFGIVFEVQGWEFPAVFDENGRIIRINSEAETEGHAWYGLREFSEDSRPDAFPTRLADYYPDGIRDPEGRPVADIREECCARDMFGNPIHAEWVEVRDHEQNCYQMCRNNPVWRGYLKKIIEIQIDAGVRGIQLDECELPMTSIGSGGCFCRHCMREFTEYLVERREEGRLSPEWDGIDVRTFDYGEYLRETGSPYPDGAPFFSDYWAFQVRQVRRYFSELADYAKEYARSRYGKEIPVSGNFYNLQPAYHPIVPKADIIITEMEHTLFRQPYFYRYSAGFAEGKPVIIAENPYGGIVPELVSLLDRGKGYDLYRLFMLEASVYGCNMSVPYGSWMGNTIKDAFWPPRSVTEGIQAFLSEHEDFFPGTRVKGAAVLYSFGSNCMRDAHRAGNANGDAMASSGIRLGVTTTDYGDTLLSMPFWDVIRAMSSVRAVYDVKMMPDGDLREDDFTAEKLTGYPMLVLPDCFLLTGNQADIIRNYAEEGGAVLVYGRLAEGTGLAEALRSLPNVRFVGEGEPGASDAPAFLKVFEEMYGEVSVVRCESRDLGLMRYDDDAGTYVHLLNYAYDPERDAVEPARGVELVLDDVPGGEVRVYRLDGEADDFEAVRDGERLTVKLREVSVYTAVTVRP